MIRPPAPSRRRLSREDRHAQLVEVARALVREDGTDALTLGRLAERAGVTKPVAYDHFETREGLLLALYRDHDARQNALLDAELATRPPVLADRAGIIASAYVDCVLTEGREIPGIAAALAGTPGMDALKRGYQAAFLARCRDVLAPFTALAPPALWAMLGAADALSDAALRGEVTKDEAVAELRGTILSMVERGRPAQPVQSSSGA